MLFSCLNFARLLDEKWWCDRHYDMPTRMPFWKEGHWSGQKCCQKALICSLLWGLLRVKKMVSTYLFSRAVPVQGQPNQYWSIEAQPLALVWDFSVGHLVQNSYWDQLRPSFRQPCCSNSAQFSFLAFLSKLIDTLCNNGPTG